MRQVPTSRMTRRLFTFISALSLLLCVSTCVLRVLAAIAPTPVFRLGLPCGRWSAVTTAGAVGIDEEPRRLREYRELNERLVALLLAADQAEQDYYRRWDFHAKPPGPARLREAELAKVFAMYDETWREYETARATPPGPFATYSLPWWTLAMTFSGLPVVWLRLASVQRRRAWRGRSGLCPTCGYDLRASPDRCPECGMVPAVKGAGGRDIVEHATIGEVS
jgi:hypothetical protein